MTITQIKSSYEIVLDEYQDRDMHRLIELFSSVYFPENALLCPRYNRWIYCENPHGAAQIVKAVEDGVLIGFMALIPVRLACAGEDLTGYYVVNVLVHPKRRGRGVFAEMIGVAKAFAEKKECLLIGHPNDEALTAWRRAEMHFQDCLYSHLARPRIFSRIFHAFDISQRYQMDDIIVRLNDRASCSRRLKVALSSDYLYWRYFLHPVYKYKLRVVQMSSGTLCLSVIRRIKFGVHLLVDQFTNDGCPGPNFSCMPWLTVSFSAKGYASGCNGVGFRAPLRKAIPFFCTSYCQQITAPDAAQLGLSATDFA